MFDRSVYVWNNIHYVCMYLFRYRIDLYCFQVIEIINKKTINIYMLVLCGKMFLNTLY